MALFTKSNSQFKLEQIRASQNAGFVCRPKFAKGNYMMGVKIAMLCTLLACPLISHKYSAPPINVRLGLAENFLSFGSAMSPVGCVLSSSFMCHDGITLAKLQGFAVMPRDEFGNAKTDTVHIGFDFNNPTTSTTTVVFPLVFFNPQVNTFVVVPRHVLESSIIVGVLQVKEDELLETLPQSGGNQQPSLQYTEGRFRDYRSGSVCLITGQSVLHESDDIVLSHGNMGQKVNGLKFNDATLIKSRYVPGSDIVTSGTDANKVAVAMLNETSGGVIAAYPPLSVSSSETLFWINARSPFIYLYVTDDDEFGFGFTGFKIAAQNTKVAGQVLAALQLTVPGPRYHAQVYGFTS